MMCLEELLLYARNTFKYASRETGENVSNCFLVEFSPRSGKSEDLYFSKKKRQNSLFVVVFFYVYWAWGLQLASQQGFTILHILYDKIWEYNIIYDIRVRWADISLIRYKAKKNPVIRDHVWSIQLYCHSLYATIFIR